MTQLDDLHCHLAFMANGTDVAAAANEAGCLLFNNSVTPEEWAESREAFAPFPNVTTGFGLHPWWVPENFDTEALCDLLAQHEPRILGEIGLDFGRRHESTISQQKRAFKTFIDYAAERERCLLSIHSVHSTADVLDVLQSSGVTASNTVIFHWFTGPSDLLKQAIEMGCYFSCGPRMLKTGKGREYVKAIPADRLLLETDWPPEQGATCTFTDLHAQLESVATSIAAIKGPDVLSQIATTSTALLAK